MVMEVIPEDLDVRDALIPPLGCQVTREQNYEQLVTAQAGKRKAADDYQR